MEPGRLVITERLVDARLRLIWPLLFGQPPRRRPLKSKSPYHFLIKTWPWFVSRFRWWYRKNIRARFRCRGRGEGETGPRRRRVQPGHGAGPWSVQQAQRSATWWRRWQRLRGTVPLLHTPMLRVCHFLKTVLRIKYACANGRTVGITMPM